MKKFLDWIEFQLDRLWQRIENSCENDSHSLSKIRIVYGLFILLFFNPSFAWIGGVPQGLFRPKFFSFSNLFNGFPSYNSLLILEVLLIICAFGILLGIKARLVGIAFTVICLIGNSFSYSFGKVDHGNIMLLVFTLGLSFTNWGVYNALVPDRRVSQSRQNKILAVLAVILCFGMFTAGFEKALYWIDFDLQTGGFLRWFYNGFYTNGRDYLLAPAVTKLPPQIFELADYFAVIFELTPLLAIFLGKKWWWGWLLVASTFHLANTLLLNISFTAHAPVYLTFISLSWLHFEGKISLLNKSKFSYFLSAIAFAIGIHYLIDLLSGKSVYSPLRYAIPLVGGRTELNLYVSLFVWSIVIVLIGLAVFKQYGFTAAKTPQTTQR